MDYEIQDDWIGCGLGIGWQVASLVNRRGASRSLIWFIWLLIGNMLCGIWFDYMIRLKHEYVLSDMW